MTDTATILKLEVEWKKNTKTQKTFFLLYIFMQASNNKLID